MHLDDYRGCLFFFSSRRRHTRFDCDWSSDVCSSDLMDGELVILDEQGRPSFQRLQNRARIGRAPEIRHASVETPGTLYLFDLMAVEGFDLRSLPPVKRKALLRKGLPAAGAPRDSEAFAQDGAGPADPRGGSG